MESVSSAEDPKPENVEDMVDTQERSDAMAAPVDESEEPIDEAATVTNEEPVENINIDPEAGPEEAGELPGPPVDSPVEPASAGDDEVESPQETVAEAVHEEPTAETIIQPDEQASVEDEIAPEPVEETAEEEPTPETSRIKRGDLIEGTVTETSPTAIMVDLGEGMEGIIPGRELERMTRQTLEELKEGQSVTVYVVNPNDHRGRTILSLNRALEELDWQEAEAFRSRQDVYEGNIAGYNKGGLIVRFGRLRGFVPQSQISDERRRTIEGGTPEERYSDIVGDQIAVKVMEVDRSRNRLILSERAAAREQREKRKEELIEELSVGQVCNGRVVSMEDFGAFVDVGGAEGLVHLTEMAWRHVTHPSDVVEIGDEVKVEVISIDPKRKRIGLSIKRQQADPWDEIATTYQVGDLVQGTVTKLTKFGAFAQLVDAKDIEGLIHISELSEQRVNHPRDVVSEGEKLTLRVVKIDVKNRRLGLSLKRVNSAEYLDRDLKTFASEADD